MDYGNYGYLDQLTGAGWRAPRTNWRRHSRTALASERPRCCADYVDHRSRFALRNNVLRRRPASELSFAIKSSIAILDPMLLRAYPTAVQGAGYSASIENILTAGTDNWFRPVDVCAAPDGSLYVVDWYDPGVGGHQMGDLDRGRLYRIAPDKAKYEVKSLDVSTPEKAVAALASPNQAVRYKASQALIKQGKSAVPAIEKLAASSNPRRRARALWALAKFAREGSRALARRCG